MRPLLTLSLLLPCLSFAAEQPSYTGPDNCRFFNDLPQEYQRGTWSGGCADGYASGSGVLQWYRGDQAVGGYQGTMEHGQPHGKGEYFMNDGSTHKGEFSNGRMSGPGVTVYANRGTLTGNFDGREMIGDVDFVYLDGRRYHGGWALNSPNGAGTMYYSTGGSLTGNWLGGQPDGKGIVNYPNGKQREVDFSAGDKTRSTAEGSERYTMREHPEGRVTTEKYTLARGSDVPFDKSYAQLTPEQQARIKDAYVILQDDDEPPYPVAGPRAIFKFLSDAQQQLNIEAEIGIDVIVDKDGKATGARIVKSPLPDLSRYIVGELLKQKYKPAKCAGEPCEMAYRLRFKLSQG